MLKGKLGWKGERGYSAYEIAVQNGFIGTEEEWLATLGTSSHFDQNKVTYTTEEANEDEFALPITYTSDCFVDVYVEGERLNASEYTLDTTNNKVKLTTPLEVVGTKVEIVMMKMSTNNLPIVDSINSSSTNETAPGTKATYDFVNGLFAVVTGEMNPPAQGSSSSEEVDYPTGFTQSNCVVISCGTQTSASSDEYMFESSPIGSANFQIVNASFPHGVRLGEEKVVFTMTNPSVADDYSVSFKIVLMKVGE